MRNFHKLTKAYKKLVNEKNSCESCKIFNDYKQVVQSEGNVQNPTFMIVAEAPGQEELKQKRPMIGPAGQELRKHLREFGFNKSNTILTNVIPCRPLNNKFPDDWNLVTKCAQRWLLKEIKLLNPKIIISCGAQALRAITGKKRVTSNRGRWHFEYKVKTWIMPTWHPSYILRCKNDINRQNVSIEFKNDLQKVSCEWMQLINDWRLKTKNKDSLNKFNFIPKDIEETTTTTNNSYFFTEEDGFVCLDEESPIDNYYPPYPDY